MADSRWSNVFEGWTDWRWSAPGPQDETAPRVLMGTDPLGRCWAVGDHWRGSVNLAWPVPCRRTRTGKRRGRAPRGLKRKASWPEARRLLDLAVRDGRPDLVFLLPISALYPL